MLDARGVPSSIIYYVGPLLRARYWEATAVPELRVYAQRVADRLLSEMGAGIGPTVREVSVS